LLELIPFFGPILIFYDSIKKSKSVINFLENYSNIDFFKIPKAKKIAEEG